MIITPNAQINGTNTKLGNLVPYTLYDNNSGSKGDITFSDVVSNFEYLEIFYQDDNDVRSSQKYKYSATKQGLVLSTVDNFGSAISLCSKGYLVSGNSISARSGRTTVTTISGTTVTTEIKDFISILKVVGYK